MKHPDSESVTVTLTPELAAFVERCVASGRFASPQDVIRQAVQRLSEHDQDNWAADVRRAVVIGVEQAKAGQLRSGASVFEELRRRARRPLTRGNG
jgi:putative addiction module CopG family antidote